MKVLFSIPGRIIRLVDKNRMIFEDNSGLFFDMSGKPVPEEDGFKDYYYICYNNLSNDPWEAVCNNNEGLKEPLLAESIEEVVQEIDDSFGKFGFINRAGGFVIEPQYAFAREFTCCLAAVNLNRTWYRTSDGKRFYENHWGYINERGKTVIPFAYYEAWPFNRYQVAVVCDDNGSHLIDKNGKIIPGTEDLGFGEYYDYHNRFLEFYCLDKDAIIDQNTITLIGIYDTKERRILLEPSITDFIEWSEEQILVYEYCEVNGVESCTQYYINSKGEKLYPWLLGRGFTIVEKPNQSLITIVAIAEFTQNDEMVSGYIMSKGKKYDRHYKYGVISSKGDFIIPMEYEKINEIAENIFTCEKDGIVTVIQVEECDF